VQQRIFMRELRLRTRADRVLRSGEEDGVRIIQHYRFEERNGEPELRLKDGGQEQGASHRERATTPLLPGEG
jgi:hypothetical protein